MCPAAAYSPCHQKLIYPPQSLAHSPFSPNHTLHPQLQLSTPASAPSQVELVPLFVTTAIPKTPPVFSLFYCLSHLPEAQYRVQDLILIIESVVLTRLLQHGHVRKGLQCHTSVHFACLLEQTVFILLLF